MFLILTIIFSGAFVWVSLYCNHPPGKKVRSFSARGLFDSLLFNLDLTINPEDFCFIYWEVDGGPLFGSLNLLMIIPHIV